VSNPVRSQYTVSSIVNHDETVSTLILRPSRRSVRFKPGQFLHLALDPYDPTLGFWPESRIFSIASAPFNPEVTIAYAVKGAFTKRMKQELEIGRDVWVRLPYGHFIITPEAGKEVVLVAGGTGITPFIAFLLDEMKHPSTILLRLVYGVRKPEHFLFTDTLTSAIAQLHDFRLSAFCEHTGYEGKRFFVNQGSLSCDDVWIIADDPVNADFYLSGPAAMIKSFRTGLLSRGVPADKIHIDEWE
jgi:ferredoxin-NADP reductase